MTLRIGDKKYDLEKAKQDIKKDDFAKTYDVNEKLFDYFNPNAADGDTTITKEELKGSIMTKLKSYDKAGGEADDELTDEELTALQADIENEKTELKGKLSLDGLKKFVVGLFKASGPEVEQDVEAEEEHEEETTQYDYVVHEGTRFKDLLKKILINQGVKEEDITPEKLEEAEKAFVEANPPGTVKERNGKKYLLAGARVKVQADFKEELANPMEESNKWADRVGLPRRYKDVSGAAPKKEKVENADGDGVEQKDDPEIVEDDDMFTQTWDISNSGTMDTGIFRLEAETKEELAAKSAKFRELKAMYKKVTEGNATEAEIKEYKAKLEEMIDSEDEVLQTAVAFVVHNCDKFNTTKLKTKLLDTKNPIVIQRLLGHEYANIFGKEVEMAQKLYELINDEEFIAACDEKNCDDLPNELRKHVTNSAWAAEWKDKALNKLAKNAYIESSMKFKENFIVGFTSDIAKEIIKDDSVELSDKAIIKLCTSFRSGKLGPAEFKKMRDRLQNKNIKGLAYIARHCTTKPNSYHEVKSGDKLTNLIVDYLVKNNPVPGLFNGCTTDEQKKEKAISYEKDHRNDISSQLGHSEASHYMLWKDSYAQLQVGEVLDFNINWPTP